MCNSIKQSKYDMKIYTTVREDGNIGPDIIAKNFNDAEKELEKLLIINNLIQISKSNKRYRVVGEKITL
jgi:hypothetical protein